jgi:hypothetical protein
MIDLFFTKFFINYNLVLGFNTTFNPPSSFALITSFVIPLLLITPLIHSSMVLTSYLLNQSVISSILVENLPSTSVPKPFDTSSSYFGKAIRFFRNFSYFPYFLCSLIEVELSNDSTILLPTSAPALALI